MQTQERPAAKNYSRKGKMGFPVPLVHRFSGEFRPVLDELVTGERAVARRVSA
jgi:hypothetical protein